MELKPHENISAHNHTLKETKYIEIKALTEKKHTSVHAVGNVLVGTDGVGLRLDCMQCDQIGRFIGLWATFKAFGKN